MPAASWLMNLGFAGGTAGTVETGAIDGHLRAVPSIAGQIKMRPSIEGGLRMVPSVAGRLEAKP